MEENRWFLEILGVDELEGEERARVERLLEDDPRARELIQRLREVERSKGPLGVLSFESGPSRWPSPLEAEEAGQSLAELRFRLLGARALRSADQARKEGSWHPRWAFFRTVFRSPLLMPLVVGALTVLFMRANSPQERRDSLNWGDRPMEAAPARPFRFPRLLLLDPPVRSEVRARGGRGLEGLLPASVFRLIAEGETRGGSTGEWRTGDAFSLRIQLEQDAHVALVHIDSAGQLQRLYPRTTQEQKGVHRAGELLELPSPSSDEEWIFEGSPGDETFLLAIFKPGNPGIDRLEKVLTPFASSGDSRDDLVEAVTSALEAQGALVETLVAKHSM